MLCGPWVGRLPRMALSERDRAILDFERAWRSGPGPKGSAIRQQFAISPGRYYQLLSGLLATQEADAYDPMVVRRLRRLRDRRRRARYEGRAVEAHRSR